MSNLDPLLEARLKREAEFHDTKYGTGGSPRHYAVGPTQYVYSQMRDALGDLHGKRVLEYGCGEGWITRDLVELGGTVCAFDIFRRLSGTQEAPWQRSNSWIVAPLT